jgi:hypothetical protein
MVLRTVSGLANSFKIIRAVDRGGDDVCAIVRRQHHLAVGRQQSEGRIGDLRTRRNRCNRIVFLHASKWTGPTIKLRDFRWIFVRMLLAWQGPCGGVA